MVVVVALVVVVAGLVVVVAAVEVSCGGSVGVCVVVIVVVGGSVSDGSVSFVVVATVDASEDPTVASIDSVVVSVVAIGSLTPHPNNIDATISRASMFLNFIFI